MTSSIPVGSNFLSSSIDVFHPSTIQVQSLLKAIDLKSKENSKAFEQFLLQIESDFSDKDGNLKKCAFLLPELEKQISTCLQTNKRNLQLYSQKRQQIELLSENEFVLKLTTLFQQAQEDTLHDLLRTENVNDQIMLAKALSKLSFFIRHGKLFFNF